MECMINDTGKRVKHLKHEYLPTYLHTYIHTCVRLAPPSDHQKWTSFLLDVHITFWVTLKLVLSVCDMSPTLNSCKNSCT